MFEVEASYGGYGVTIALSGYACLFVNSLSQNVESVLVQYSDIRRLTRLALKAVLLRVVAVKLKCFVLV